MEIRILLTLHKSIGKTNKRKDSSKEGKMSNMKYLEAKHLKRALQSEITKSQLPSSKAKVIYFSFNWKFPVF